MTSAAAQEPGSEPPTEGDRSLHGVADGENESSPETIVKTAMVISSYQVACLENLR